jgi:hypothetical protein
MMMMMTVVVVVTVVLLGSQQEDNKEGNSRNNGTSRRTRGTLPLRFSSNPQENDPFSVTVVTATNDKHEITKGCDHSLFFPNKRMGIVPPLCMRLV